METSDWIKSATDKLTTQGISTARLDAMVLLEDATGKDRAWLIAHPEFELSDSQAQKLNRYVARRASHEPLAYIRNKTEFYGREFYIDHHVLEPRPESETMIERLKHFAQSAQGPTLRGVKSTTIIDVGTGSGALAITAKLELPGAEVVALDIDENCLKVARKNAKTHSVKIRFLPGDLLTLVPYQILNTKYLILICNLPYVPDSFTTNPAAMREPRIAIFGGPDGLDLYRRMFQQIDELELSPALIFTESLPPQHEKLANIAEKSGFKLIETDDFIQLFSKL